MRKEQARDVGLFFLLGLMDEKIALAAAGRVIAKIKAKENFPDEMVPPVEFIRLCRESWRAHRSLVTRHHSVDSPNCWVVPADLDIAIWSRFQKDSSDEDVMTILFSVVFGFEDQDLAAGFETSVGTIRYRLGKGIRQLGLVVRTQKPVLSPGAKQ